ncbi:MAG: hypothetical protein RJA07_8 [Bacteroidota bacterium]|jgi:hypothetical protein
MSDNKETSKNKKEFWTGEDYVQYYDANGNKIGSSKDEKGNWITEAHTKHYDADGNEIGSSQEKKETWSNENFIQHYKKDGSKSGSSRIKKDRFTGKEYIQHYDENGNEIGASEEKEEFWTGDKYTEHDGKINYTQTQKKQVQNEDNSMQTWLGKILGAVILIAAIVWFIFKIAIPLIAINLAVIFLITTFAKKNLLKYFLPLSIIAAIYLLIDFNSNLLCKSFSNEFPSMASIVNFFFYLNIVAGLISTYFFIRNYLNQHTNEDVSNEFSKRNLVLMSIIVVLGASIFGVQTILTKRLNHSANEPESTIISTEQGNIKSSISDNSGSQSIRNFFGNVGALKSSYNLYWDENKNIAGTYFYNNNPSIIYSLKGKDLENGNIELKEFTNGILTAECNLHLMDNCYVGQMSNTDGKKYDMNICSSPSIAGRFPNSSERILYNADFESLSKQDLLVMRNEIYARHGYIFKTDKFCIDYFANQSWYKGEQDDVSGMLSEIENKNVQLILKNEKQ